MSTTITVSDSFLAELSILSGHVLYLAEVDGKTYVTLAIEDMSDLVENGEVQS